MMDAVLALRRAIHARLLSHAPLIAALGGARIHDEAPRAASGPYIVHGDVEAKAWSSGSSEGCEQTIRLVVWAARPGETASALAIAEEAATALHEAALQPAGHVLIQLRQTGLDLARDDKTALSRITLIFRAVTERA